MPSYEDLDYSALFRSVNRTPPADDASKSRGIIRGAGDLGLEVASGVTRGVGMLASTFGANNPVASAARSTDEFIREYLSAQSKDDSAKAAAILAEAEDQGVGAQVVAGLRAFGQAPFSMIANTVGMAVPTIAGGAAALGGRAAAGSARAIGAMAGIGAASGVGEAKGGIFDSVKAEYMKQPGMTEAEAELRAEKAQQYSSENAGNLAVAGGLGALAGSTGYQPVVARLLKGGVADAAESGMLRSLAGNRVADLAETRAGKALAGGLVEGGTEFLQGGQQQYAANAALQNEGFDTPTWRGVVSQGAMEAIAGGVVGAGFGALDKPGARGEAKKPSVVDVLDPSKSLDESINTATTVLGQSAQLGDSIPAAQPIKPRAAGEDIPANVPEALPNLGGTFERTMSGIAADADQARGEQRRASELDAIPGMAQAQDEQAAILAKAATLESPSAMAEAFKRVQPTEPASTAPAEPRIVKRTDDMVPTSLEKAQQEADTIGGEVVRVQNQSGKFAYVAMPSAIQPGDLLTSDQMPYGSKLAAKLRAKREGFGLERVIEIPGAGWVVRTKEIASVPVPDVPRTAGMAAGAADERAPAGLGSGRAVRPLPDGDRGSDTASQAPSSGSGAVASAGSGSGPDQALTPGSTVTLDGKAWTVTSATPRLVKLDDGQGEKKAISPNSEKWKQATSEKADAQPVTSPPRSQEAEAPTASAPAADTAAAAGGAVEADGLKGRETAIAAFKRAAEAKFPGRDTVRTAEMAADRLLPMIEAKNADGLIDMNLGSADMNPASRAAFEAVTGVKLPKGRAATERAIDGWAGVTEQQRSEKDAARNAQREADGAKKDAEWARKSAATVQVKDGDRTVDGASWVDELIAKGFTKIVRRGPKTFLANEAGNGWPMMHKDIAEYARKASAAPTPTAATPVEAASTSGAPAPVAGAPAERDSARDTPLSMAEREALVQVTAPAPARVARDGRMDQLEAEDEAATAARSGAIQRLTAKGIKPTREVVGQTRKSAANGGGYAPKYQWQLKDTDGTYLELTDSERDSLTDTPVSSVRTSAERVQETPENEQVAPEAPAKKPKVYKTKTSAQLASKLSGNTKRVKKIAGGFILRDATDKELAAAGAASKRGRSMAGGGPGLLAQIARRGGIDRQSAARDLGVNKDDFNRPSGIFGRPVFSASAGKSAEHMLESLIEDKYLLDGATLRDLEDAIGDALNGRAVLALDHDYSDGMAARQAEIEANFYAEDDPLADLTSDDLQDIGYIGASAEAQQASEELIAAAEALGIDVDTIRENADSETRGQTDDQYQAAVQRLAREAIASAGQNAQGADASAAGAGNQDRGQSTGDQGQEESSAANRLARIGASVDAVARQWQRDNNPLEASILDAWDLNIGAANNEQIEDAIVALGKLRKALGDGKATTKARIDARVQELRAGQGAEEGLTLEAQTPADLLEKAEREAAAADDDKKEQARIKREDDKARERRELGDRTRQDASADGFELGQSRADVIRAMAGNGDMFADADATQAAAILDAAPDPFADNYAALNGKTITQLVLVADTGKTATLRMDAGQALRDVNERETALVKLKACIGR